MNNENLNERGVASAEPVCEVHPNHLRPSTQPWCREVLLYSGNHPGDHLDGKNYRVKLYTEPQPCSKCAENEAWYKDRLESVTASHNQTLRDMQKQIAEAERRLAHIKEVEFPRRVAKVAEGWRKKVEAAEHQIEALTADRDSWADQASQRTSDWEAENDKRIEAERRLCAAIQSASDFANEKHEAERQRDEYKADAERLDALPKILLRYDLGKSRHGFTFFPKSFSSNPIVEAFYTDFRELIDAATAAKSGEGGK